MASGSIAIFLRARAEIENLLCEQRAVESTTREQLALLIFSTCNNPYGNPFI